MSSAQNYRLYTFVAGLYLSELQKGLQSAHVVSELADQAMGIIDDHEEHEYPFNKTRAYRAWAEHDKTLIICNAMNHGGVKACWAEIQRLNSALNLPAAIFHEDEESMNGMATACGVVVPAKYYDVEFIAMDEPFASYWEHVDPETQWASRYPLTHAEGQFISHIKKYRLA